MTSLFTISTSCHGQPCIELTDATKEQHWFLRRVLRDNFITSEFYKHRQKANPFFQGGYDDDHGWILIEFWGPIEACQPYVDWLNTVYEDTVSQAKKHGLL